MADSGDVQVKWGLKDNTGPGASSVKRRMGGLEKQIKGLVSGFTALMVAREVGRQFQLMIKASADLEQAIKDVGLISGATAKEFALLNAKAKELGRTTEFTAIESAEAMKEFARAGFSAAETTNVMSTALEFASATGASLSQASEVMVATIKSYGIAAEDAAGLSDLFASAINNSRFSAASLNEALKFGAPAGAAFGQTTEDMTAALAALVDVTGQGSMAGTAYRNMLIQATNVTSEGTAVLAKYGLMVSDISPKTRSMGQVFKTLAEAGVDAGDAITLFGARAGPAVASVAKRIREGTLNWDEYAESVTKSTDAGEQAIERLNTLAGATKLLDSAINGLHISLGDELNPTLKNTKLGLADVFNEMNKFLDSGRTYTDSVKMLANQFVSLGEIMGSTITGSRTRAEVDAMVKKYDALIIKQRKAIDLADLVAVRDVQTGFGTGFRSASATGDSDLFGALSKPKGKGGRGAGKGIADANREIANSIDVVNRRQRERVTEGIRVLEIERKIIKVSLDGEDQIIAMRDKSIEILKTQYIEGLVSEKEAAAQRVLISAEAEAKILAIRSKGTEEASRAAKIAQDEIAKILEEGAATLKAEDDRKLAELERFRAAAGALAMQAGAQIVQGLVAGIRGEEDAFKNTLRALLPIIGQLAGMALSGGNPVGGAVGGILGGGLAGLFHQGGIVRAHSGMVIGAHRQVPIMTKEDESVLTPEVTRDLGEDTINASNRAGRFLGGSGGGTQIVFQGMFQDRNGIRSALRDGLLIEEIERADRMGILRLKGGR